MSYTFIIIKTIQISPYSTIIGSPAKFRV